MKNTNKTPEEALIRIFINDAFFSSLLCTPQDTKELTIGWLFNQGNMESMAEVSSIETSDDSRDIKIGLTTDNYKETDRNNVIRTVACMGGEISFHQFFKNRTKLTTDLTVTMADLKDLMKASLSLTRLYKESGGIHCAALASPSDKQIVTGFEDVGRHNAVDKVIGSMLLNSRAMTDKVLLTSGRISSEMALKAANGKIPVIATITACTDLAVNIADAAGLTVVGRVLSASPKVWCGEERIKK